MSGEERLRKGHRHHWFPEVLREAKTMLGVGGGRFVSPPAFWKPEKEQIFHLSVNTRPSVKKFCLWPISSKVHFYVFLEENTVEGLRVVQTEITYLSYKLSIKITKLKITWVATM